MIKTLGTILLELRRGCYYKVYNVKNILRCFGSINDFKKGENALFPKVTETKYRLPSLVFFGVFRQLFDVCYRFLPDNQKNIIILYTITTWPHTLTPLML